MTILHRIALGFDNQIRSWKSQEHVTEIPRQIEHLRYTGGGGCSPFHRRWAGWITEHNNYQIGGPLSLPFAGVNICEPIASAIFLIYHRRTSSSCCYCCSRGR